MYINHIPAWSARIILCIYSQIYICIHMFLIMGQTYIFNFGAKTKIGNIKRSFSLLQPLRLKGLAFQIDAFCFHHHHYYPPRSAPFDSPPFNHFANQWQLTFNTDRYQLPGRTVCNNWSSPVHELRPTIWVTAKYDLFAGVDSLSIQHIIRSHFELAHWPHLYRLLR